MIKRKLLFVLCILIAFSGARHIDAHEHGTKAIRVFAPKQEYKITFKAQPYSEVSFEIVYPDGIFPPAGNDSAQLIIRFRLNEEGLITDIDLADDEEPEKEGLYKAGTYSADDVMAWSFKSKTLGGKVATTYRTGVILHPGNASSIDVSDESKLLYQNAEDYLNNGQTYSDFTVYKTEPGQMEASFISLPGTATYGLSDSGYKHMNFLLYTSQTIDVNGEIVTKVYYAQNDSVLTATLSKSVDLSKVPVIGSNELYDLSPGDAFLMNTNVFGEIVYVVAIYDSENHRPLGSNYNGSPIGERGYLWQSATMRYYYGYVKDFNLETEILMGAYNDPSDPNDKTFMFNLHGRKPYIYNTKNNTIRLGNSEDISSYNTTGLDCSKVAIYTYQFGIEQLFIIE